ncbi:MAG: hypothetical protein ABI480_18885 [Chitinophagaceae bacterium]
MKNKFILFICSAVIEMSCSHNTNGDMMSVPPIPPVDTTHADTTQVEKTAIVSTFAGEGTKAFADGTLLSAKFSFPEDVTIADDGTMYVSDVLNFKIRKISGEW